MYPTPSSPAASAVMRGNRKRDTRPELRIRSALHSLGLRYRCDFPVDLPSRRSVRVDIAFTRSRVAVFVDGCFWHACPLHGTAPSSNQSYWRDKLARNVARDAENDSALVAAEWLPLHVWEHEDTFSATQRIVDALKGRKQAGEPPRVP
jgi:DNA mismatch endonuclease (patch repair protein)